MTASSRSCPDLCWALAEQSLVPHSVPAPPVSGSRQAPQPGWAKPRPWSRHLEQPERGEASASSAGAAESMTPHPAAPAAGHRSRVPTSAGIQGHRARPVPPPRLRALTDQPHQLLVCQHEGEGDPGHLQRRHEGAHQGPGDADSSFLCKGRVAMSEVAWQEGSSGAEGSGQSQGGLQGAPTLTQPTHGSASHDAQLQAGQPAQVVHHQHHRSTCEAASRVRPLPCTCRGCPGKHEGSPRLRGRWEALAGSVMCASIVSTASSAGITWQGCRGP